MNLVLGGKHPLEIRPFLGASLVPLENPDEGIQPIAVGNTRRRLAAKIISARVQAYVGELLRPIQVGYGSPNGCEAAVHAVGNFIESFSQSSHVLIKLDFRNAFNSARRDVLIKVIKQYLPNYYGYFRQSYYESSYLLSEAETIMSSCGIQQGDPLGSLAFALVTLDLAKSLESNLKVWFLDDASLSGTKEKVVRDVKKVEIDAAEFGLELSRENAKLRFLGAQMKKSLTPDCMSMNKPEH